MLRVADRLDTCYWEHLVKGGADVFKFLQEVLRFIRNESGQTMTEYELVMLLVSIVAIVSLVAIGNHLSATYTTVGTTMP